MKEFKQKPKQLCNYVRAKQKVKVGISRLEKENGEMTTMDEEAANVLNGFFDSVFTIEPEGEVPELDPRHRGVIQADCEFTVEDVVEQLRKLKADKSPGMDGIHPQVLNLCADEMSKLLFIIHKKSLEEGRLPKEWKDARVIPIYKKGSKKATGNYRPVSLTSIPCKIMESIIRKSILEHVEDLGLLSQEQHGFTKG